MSKTLISIDRDCHDEELTGFILEANKNLIVMSLYCENGHFEGFTIFKTDQIDEVYWGNREHKSIHALIGDSAPKSMKKLKAKDLHSAIKELGEIYSSLCIYSHNNEDNFDIIRVISEDDEWLKIQTFGPKRSLSQLNKLIRTDSISRIDFDSPYQNNIVKLHDSDL